MVYTLLAYLMWGFFPAFFPLLLPAGPLEILAHRLVWCALFMVIVLLLIRGWGELRRAGLREWGWLALAGLLISVNWGIYVLAVNSGHVADAALGYFINPLLSIALGMLFLGERLRRWQVVSVIIAAAGVVWLAFLTGQPPYLAIGLALSFGFYGLIKKRVTVSAAASLTAEALAMTPVAVIYLVWLASRGESTFTSEGPGHTALLLLAGVVTAAPLFFFGAGAKKIPLATVGMLQYITPTMQMLWALFVTHEYLSASRWIGYIIIWIAVAVYLADLLNFRRTRRPA
ncbi:EamA family transporter RarD [Corynebacterium doosanense]|uniref:Protein rarD n=1 Tax=Corynebacterium doosanense CAU 212 = DSM 45436 TaxID=558173 RepID=A0A097IH54_9CORY|nr:EamA family transporter RarD [Corynebacterium doosanense]AIT61439.1 protein rarD [Corynebacterium doosanense CAU 212 = DSM 45436]